MQWQQTDPEITEMVQRLMDVSRPLDRGCILQWSVIEDTTGLSRNDMRLRYIVQKWRRRLRNDRGIETWSEHTVGMRLLTDTETITTLAAKRTKKAKRQQTMTLRALQNVRTSELTNNQRLQLLALQDAIRAARKKTTQSAVFSRPITGDRERLLAHLQQQQTGRQ